MYRSRSRVPRLQRPFPRSCRPTFDSTTSSSGKMGDDFRVITLASIRTAVISQAKSTRRRSVSERFRCQRLDTFSDLAVTVDGARAAHLSRTERHCPARPRRGTPSAVLSPCLTTKHSTTHLQLYDRLEVRLQCKYRDQCPCSASWWAGRGTP